MRETLFKDLPAGAEFICPDLRKPDFPFVKTDKVHEDGNTIGRVLRTGDEVPIAPDQLVPGLPRGMAR